MSHIKRDMINHDISQVDNFLSNLGMILDSFYFTLLYVLCKNVAVILQTLFVLYLDVMYEYLFKLELD